MHMCQKAQIEHWTACKEALRHHVHFQCGIKFGYKLPVAAPRRAFAPQSVVLPLSHLSQSPHPPSRRKKVQNQPFWFCPSSNAFCPLNAPQKFSATTVSCHLQSLGHLVLLWQISHFLAKLSTLLSYLSEMFIDPLCESLLLHFIPLICKINIK